MRKFLTIAAGAITVLAAGGYAFMSLKKPASAPPAAITIESSEARVAQGRYIFEILSDCGGCHSMRDFSRFGGPVVAGHKAEGTIFPREFGLPGDVSAPNITPDRETGIGAWSDGEIVRAIREGIGRDGHALFPMMPYSAYRSMSDEDVYSLVAYLRTLPPVKNRLPKTRIDFPVWFFIKSVPQPVAAPVPPPDRANRLKYGEYLVVNSGCAECHTQAKNETPDPTMKFAGGREFKLPGLIVVSANITPEPETGIGRWTEQQFLEKFAEYKTYATNGSPKVGPEGFTLMPWLNFSQLPAEDLGAIYTYLKVQPPVRNAVETHPGYPSKR
ncbi:MAG: cytochrome c [Bryobacterales bacterium]|nr:cytochrome c [Bryobacterales bacterium]